MTPPRLAQWLLRAAAPPGDRRFLLGDLAEELDRVAADRGARAARRWYWRQALASAAPLAARRVAHASRRAARVRLTPAGAVTDARQGARWLVRHPRTAATVVATLSVAFSAVLSGFVLIDGVVLRPLPFPDPDRIVSIHVSSPTRPASVRSASFQDVEDWHRRATTFEAVSAYTSHAFRMTGRGEPRQLEAERVGMDFQRVLGVRAVAGRLFEPADFTSGARTAILTHGFWRREFGGDPSAVGGTLLLDEEPYRIVGVLAPIDLTFPEPHDLWVPLVVRTGAFWESSRGTGWVFPVGRVRAGVDVPAAEAELTTIARKLAEEHPRSNADKTVATLAPIAEDLLGQPGRALALLGIALGAVLLMACGNLANLLLASASLREVEFSVRGALGAGRYRLARQIAAETAMLSTVSAAIALAAAPWLARMFHAAYPTPLPRGEMPALAPSSLLATAAMAFSAAVLLAAPQMASAYRSSRSAGPAGTRTTARGDRFTGYALISVQVALSLLLLAAGVALVRTLAKLEAVDPGYRTDGLLTFSVSPSPQRFRTAASATLFYDEVVRSIGELPGVRAAAAGVGVPLTSGGWRFGIRRPGAATDTLVAVNLVSPGYFDALGVRPREGRLLTDAEQRTGAGVAMVNASLARVLSAGGESVVGRQMNYSGQAWTIVGVLEDVRQSGPRNAVMPELVIPWHLAGKRPQAIVVRSDGDPLRLLPAITARIHAIDPTAPLTDVARIQDRLRKDTAAERFRASLLAALAGVAILLAALGAYSVTAYAVARRTREYGIRLALGERPRAVCRRALRTAVSPAIAGLVLGTGASLAGARFLQGFLHEVDAADAGTLAIGGAILLAIATAAAAMSARRAAHVDPIVALRAE